MDYDVLVVGAGIGGMESALALGDMGFRVLLVEKQASVGGKMILLSKVFPTLDCASCISTPKMAATQNHPNVRTMVYTEVDRIVPHPGGKFTVDLRRKATYVDFAKCTGCSLCETACTVALPDEFNADLAARHAAHIVFPQAVPKRAVITRLGLSPCSATCPAGVKPHGYISLVRAGLHDEAFRQHLEDAPLPGVLSRACYAPCEGECSRTDVDGTVSIRGIKRFMVDRYYAAHPEPEYGPPATKSGKSVAIVGSGPAGLTAAFYLARAGHAVTIFEAEAEPGGMLRYGIPSYRLPKDVLARDVRNITALGVRIETNHRVASPDALAGFDAILLATGTPVDGRLGIPGESLPGVLPAMTLLKKVNQGAPPPVGRRVVVVGGGDVAMDAARSALRASPGAIVTILYRRSRAEMPAHPEEVRLAEEEGIQFLFQKAPTSVVGSDQVEGVVAQGMTLGPADESGRRRPVPVPGSETTIPCDTLVVAVGLHPEAMPEAPALARADDGTIRADGERLVTSVPRVYAAGDVVAGPASIVEAIGQGKRAAYHILRALEGLDPANVRFDERLPTVDRSSVVAKARANATPRPRAMPPGPTVADRLRGFVDTEVTMSEADARANANRCLDCGGCSDCRECVRACPADAIVLDMRPTLETVNVGAVALATGFETFDARRKPLLGFGRYPNVITGLQMDRILAPTRPYNAVVRPSDGKAPGSVAFVLCAGSRDESVQNRVCSRVCCMYSLKQAQLLMGALPVADITVYYTDIRSYGKGYEEFYQQAKGMGVNFVRGKVARIEPAPNDDLVVHYEAMEGAGGHATQTHDLVVLAVGLLPAPLPPGLVEGATLERDALSYVREVDEELEPARTNIEGMFAIGAATAVRDIPDTVLHSGAAAAQIASYLKRRALA